MLKTVLQFIGYTFAVAIFGVAFLFLSTAFLPESREPSGVSFLLLLISVVLIYGSPFIVGWWIWKRRHDGMLKRDAVSIAARNSAKAIERDYAAAEAERVQLRSRFFARERLISAVDKHKTALLRNLERAVRKNDYGLVVEDRRQEAMFEFFASIDLDIAAIGLFEAIEVVAEQLASYDEQNRELGFDPENIPFDGHAFERWVASALSGFGWTAEVTVASGDQGIDVLASRDGLKIGLQCKLYSSPIGNKAVQEAHAGKAFHGVDKVGVISNADFTSSAKSLALATGVMLLSHRDIPNLYEKVTTSRLR